MSYTSIKKARIERQLAQVTALLEALNETYLSLSAQSVQSYEFDSGEGSQRVTRRQLLEIQNQIDRLEAKERSLLNELYNMGNVSIRVRRKKPNC